jgi:hypothetical protein
MCARAQNGTCAAASLARMRASQSGTRVAAPVLFAHACVRCHEEKTNQIGGIAVFSFASYVFVLVSCCSQKKQSWDDGRNPAGLHREVCRVRRSVAINGQLLLFCDQSVREKAWRSRKRGA